MDPQLLNTLCVIVITLILSYFTLVLGELVPKRIAMQQPERGGADVLQVSSWPLAACYRAR